MKPLPSMKDALIAEIKLQVNKSLYEGGLISAEIYQEAKTRIIAERR